jgi:hypothetical protein
METMVGRFKNFFGGHFPVSAPHNPPILPFVPIFLPSTLPPLFEIRA